MTITDTVRRETLASPRLDRPTDAPRLAPAVVRSAALIIGVLSNGKPNADHVIDAVLDRLARAGTIGRIERVTKADPSLPATAAELDVLVSRADVVLAAVGDCGSCSSCLVSDTVELERRGAPTAVLLTGPFVPVAGALASLRGYPPLRVVPIPHPVADLDSEGIAAFVEIAAAQVAALLFDARTSSTMRR